MAFSDKDSEIKIEECFLSDVAEDYDSENNLQIVERPPRKRPIVKPSVTEKRVIESIEDELEKRLGEKAAKTNLNAVHVRSIIKHIVSNEHVLALVRHAENPGNGTVPMYEPKLTRSKAKELFSSAPSIVPIVPVAPKKPSEVQVLFTEELQEDSSGDEYVPNEYESDDQESSIFSDPPSVPPPTPPTPTPTNSVAHTSFTEDGVFKIPPSVKQEEIEDEATIARRTRSKINLSSTPLEVIEEAFVPPDITTDMYDMDCDNDDWMDFLKKFTRPLDEVAKPTEDEEQDPEYNILADEEVVDKEELRMDKAVKVSKKELNELISELFEYAVCWTNADTTTVVEDEQTNKVVEETGVKDVCSSQIRNDDTVHESLNCVVKEKIESDVQQPLALQHEEEEQENEQEEDDEETISFSPNHIQLLAQQLGQHVQMLTQNFILTYQHPELHSLSKTFKEYLLNFKYLCKGKDRSMFYTVNLPKALHLVDYWEKLVDTDNKEVREMKQFVEETARKSIAGWKVNQTYIPTFPKLMFETISKSDVFVYPTLLAKIPFKPCGAYRPVITFVQSEDHLIAMGLEQFSKFVVENGDHKNPTQKVVLKVLCSHISRYVLPLKEAGKIYNHVVRSKHHRCASNPIKYYFIHNKAPPTVHFIIPLEIVPPCQRKPCELPYQWRTYIYPNLDQPNQTRFLSPLGAVSDSNIQPAKICPKSPLAIPAKIRRRKPRPKTNRRLDPITKFVRRLSEPPEINKLLRLYPESKGKGSVVDQQFCRGSPRKANPVQRMEDKDETPAAQTSEGNVSITVNVPTGSVVTTPVHYIMLPSMPNLSTPLKTNPGETGNSGKPVEAAKEKKVLLDFSALSGSNFRQVDESTEVEFCKKNGDEQNGGNVNVILSTQNVNIEKPSTSESDGNTNEKDNMDEINALLIASSRVKPPVRKEPSGAEKKRTKLRREFLANLAVSTPESPEEERKKSEMFALKYYDKLRETLELEDYHKIMQILNDHDKRDAIDLYRKVEKVLRPKYEQLAEEFLLFLREKEAAAVSQLIPWIRMNNRSKFLRKLDIYFKDQPSQLGKIYKCLTEFSQAADLNMEEIKNTLLPMFKGNAVLTDLFLQNFLDERPPPSLLEGPYETININKELSRPDSEEIFETIVVPDVEDKYGGPLCICSCHEIEDPEFKSRYRHCIRCGTKFVNGKVFIQTGRGLRPASISFITSPNVDHNVRLMGKAPDSTSQRKKRADISPSKQVTLSPAKENNEEDSDDEIDGRKKRKKKSPRRKAQTGKIGKSCKESQKGVSKKSCTKSSSAKTKKEVKSPPRKRAYSVKKSQETKIKTADAEASEDVKSQQEVAEEQGKSSVDDFMEWEDNVASTESGDIKPNSPEQQTAESESEFCEESSQDNCESDSNSSVSSGNVQSQSDEGFWKREEDKLILETFQRENDKEASFKLIAEQLTDRSVPQIRRRFETLMKILMRTLNND